MELQLSYASIVQLPPFSHCATALFLLALFLLARLLVKRLPDW